MNKPNKLAIASKITGQSCAEINGVFVYWAGNDEESTTALPVNILAEVETEYAAQEAQYPLDACKDTAKAKIAATDWSVLPDVNLQNKAEFEAYRATLRDLIFNPVADPVWPVEPTPIPATQGA